MATLIMAANHIGNPKDLPTRSLEALKQADLLVFEEDKPARLALKTAGLHREYIKLNEHRDAQSIEAIREAFLNQKTVVYMSDQGIGTIADPGALILKIANELGVKVKSIPGPCSVTSTLQAWPYRLEKYSFYGFLPKSPQERRKNLEQYSKNDHPFVLMDTPYRLKQLMKECSEVLNANKKCLIGVDITGPEEEFILCKAKELLHATSHIQKKNFVIVIDGNKKVERKSKKKR